MLNAFLSRPWALGLFAGGTIFLGLPIAKLGKISAKLKAFLNALSTGILIFLLVEITGHLIEEIEELVKAAISEGAGTGNVYRYGGLFVLGVTMGLLGLVFFEQRFIRSA